MKENSCVNCKHKEKMEFMIYCYQDMCFAPETIPIYNAHRVPYYPAEVVREYLCKGSWFDADLTCEQKKSFMTKLICLFKGE